jgi:hypothetical protein
MEFYDLVIVGAGPSGLALAQCCSYDNPFPNSILVIDREQTIGGCHRVKRLQDGIFTEHGPRLYFSNYVNLFNLMKEFGLDIDDIFVKYKYSFPDMLKNILKEVSIYEALYFGIILTIHYLIYIFDDNYGSNINLETFCQQYSNKMTTIIDRICRIADGAYIKKYSLNRFLKITDSTILSSTYQPKHPLDISLFNRWQKFLEKRGVTFYLNSTISYIHYDNEKNKLKYVILENGKTIYFNKLVLAIPPENIARLIKPYEFKDCFGQFEKFDEWAEETDYIDYISITYHFTKELKLDYIHGVTFNTEWGIIAINLSDYMTNIENTFNTVISVAVTICDTKSSYIHKTANECSKEELYKEVYRQLRQSLYPNLPIDYVAVMNPNIYYNKNKKKWQNKDEAFFHTIGTQYIPFESKVKNLYNVGTHNGHSYVPYTTMESAVSNGIFLAKILHPKSKNRYILEKSFTTKHIVLIIILTILILSVIIFAK